MPKPWKEYHKERADLERKETLATVRQVLQLVKVCAEGSTNFEEFVKLLNNAIVRVEEKMDA